MSEISKAYEPQSVEDKWYDFWLKQGCFTADPARVSDKRPAYSIVIPPPNVTGMLHMGHVLNNTIQDILNRIVEHVLYMKHARDIRRRNHDGIRRTLVTHARRVGGETTLLQPEVIPFVLNGLRFVGFGNFAHDQTAAESFFNSNPGPAPITERRVRFLQHASPARPSSRPCCGLPQTARPFC